MSASDVAALLVAGAILYVTYNYSKSQSQPAQQAMPAVAPSGQVQQHPQIVYVNIPVSQVPTSQAPVNNTAAAAQAAYDEQVYQEYLAAAMQIGQIPKENVPGQGPSWLGCV